jgi:hypothetical protein
MATAKPTLTLSDLLSRNAPADDGLTERTNTPLGDREAIQKRTRFMRDKTEGDGQHEPAPDQAVVGNETSDGGKAPASNEADLIQPMAQQTVKKAKSASKTPLKPNDDKITRSIQFSRATYRQMEKTLNFIAYKSGRRNVSFPKYFEKLHKMAQQHPDLMNQLIDHFKTDLPD